jgi:nitrate/nitrite transporter NarK
MSWQIPLASILVSIGMNLFGDPRIGMIGGFIAAVGTVIGFGLGLYALSWFRTPRVLRHAVAGLLITVLLAWMLADAISAANRAREFHEQQQRNPRGIKGE